VSEPIDFEQPGEANLPLAGAEAVAAPRRSILPAALLGIAVLLVWRFVGVRILEKGEMQSDWLPLLLGGVLPTLFILVFPIWVLRRAGQRVIDGWPGWPGLLLEGVIAFGTLITVQMINMIVAVFYTLVFRESPGVPEQFQDLASSGSLAAFVLMAVMACVWAPISEELFFRRFVMRAFASRMSLAAAIALQAFVFAILHHYGAMHLTAIFVLGLAMGILYAWRKTIVTSMILHMLQNTMAMTLLGAIMLLSHFAPKLGVYGDGKPDGFHVAKVEEGSAAETAGIRSGDVITQVERTPVQDQLTLRLAYWMAGLDGRADLQVNRHGKRISVSIPPVRKQPPPKPNWKRAKPQAKQEDVPR